MPTASLNTPPTADNLDILDNFLAKNELPDSVVLNGYLSAIISGPHIVMPNQWIAFFGLHDVEFNSQQEAEQIMGIVMGFYNNLCNRLLQKTFSILDVEYDNPEKLSTAKMHWATGYMLGVGLFDKTWFNDGGATALLLPIMALTLSDKDLLKLLAETKHSADPKTIREACSDELTNAANEIYQYWRKKSNPQPIVKEPLIKTDHSVKAGRNDLCPCGSGKKFKKCCLH